ncbi:MAG: branched-chain amino acid ABC transporter permease [Deltaproteobacteria bacterium]|nr:branched-chain amino acid ABC transporter permease [Deltaproteobacteria bacterium]
MAQTIFRRWGREFAIAGAIVLYLLPLLGMDIRTYLTLTIAGLAMGMMLFLVASGLSLIFGLMDVINFAHGVCFAYGAYVAFSIFKYLNSWVETDSLFQNFSIFFIAIIAAIIVVGILGIIIERVLIRRVYGSHLFQILITFGGMVVLTEFIRIIWGPNDEVMPQPITFSGNWNIFDIIILKYPIYSIVLGLAVYGIIQLVLKRTKVGKIVRAGVEDPEMVQAMGHNIFLFFTAVFAAGAGLAAVGGMAMAIFNLSVYPDMGDAYLIFAFIIVIIGGLGSITGSLVGALIVGLSYNYVAYLVPPLAVGVNILIMVIILLIKPTGLFAAGK